MGRAVGASVPGRPSSSSPGRPQPAGRAVLRPAQLRRSQTHFPPPRRPQSPQLSRRGRSLQTPSHRYDGSVMSKPAMTGVRCSKEGGDQRTFNDSKYPLLLCYDIKLHPEMLEHVITTLVKFQRGLSRTGSDQRRRQQVGATPSKALSQDRAAGPSKGTVACSPLPCGPAGLSPSTPDPHASPPAWGAPPSPAASSSVLSSTSRPLNLFWKFLHSGTLLWAAH